MAHLKLKKKNSFPQIGARPSGACWLLVFPSRCSGKPVPPPSPGAWLSDALDAQTRLPGHGKSCRGQALRQGGGPSERRAALVTRTCGVSELPLQDGAHSAEGWRGAQFLLPAWPDQGMVGTQGRALSQPAPSTMCLSMLCHFLPVL